MNFSMVTSCITSKKPLQRDTLSKRISTHDLFKTVEYWQYSFEKMVIGEFGVMFRCDKNIRIASGGIWLS